MQQQLQCNGCGRTLAACDAELIGSSWLFPACIARRAIEIARPDFSEFDQEPTPVQVVWIVSKLTVASKRLARFGTLADEDSARAAAQVKRLGLGYCACRKSKSRNPDAPRVASWSPSNNLGRAVRAFLQLEGVS